MLWRFHTEFLKELTPLIKNWSNSQCIGSVFEKNVRTPRHLAVLLMLYQADVFKLYTPYVVRSSMGASIAALCSPPS